ncbi:MAG: penicillin acylase family protein [Opitutaceae bacterium]|nr:penicillin acylase family protein [Opitutaceae bacterium]
MPKLTRWLRLSGSLFVFCLLLLALFVLVPLYRSLPDRDARILMPGLAEAAAVNRDNLGIVRVSAANRRDAAKLLGFVHAQDRFFQMDLLRRTSAGEVAELLGPSALPLDRANRPHRLRDVAHAALLQLPEPQRELVEDYAYGVTLGLGALKVAPFEYLLLRTTPRPWTAEDSLLVAATMALSLERTDGEPELSRAVAREVFAPAVADFLLSPADDFESTLDGSHVEAPPLPPTLEYSAFTPPSPAAPAAEAPTAGPPDDPATLAWARPAPPSARGSNAFAVSGLQGERRLALLANDLHLPLTVPNLWYRAQITWRLDPRHNREIDGITLPGLPVLIAGTNGAIAWGFTTSYADTSDLVVVETDPANPGRYRTPEGWRDFVTHTETLAVLNAAAETLSIRSTLWGPIIGTDHRGRPLALKWAMADPTAYNLQLVSLETVNSARSALAFAKSTGLPHQNFVVADREGNLGWTLAGRLPNRVGFDGSTPVSWADGTARWDGWLETERHPQIFNPRTGMLWSANNRMIGGDSLAVLGDGGYQSGARAHRIRELLGTLKQLSPEALLAIQLDDRAPHLDRWQELLLATLTPDSSDPGRTELRRLTETWGGRALPDSAGYRLVRDFRTAVESRIDTLIFARCRAALPAFESSSLPLDRVLFALAHQQPAGWLPAGHPGWKALLDESVAAVIADAGGPTGLAAHTWGKVNRLRMQHPLSAALPWLARFLDRPAVSLPGDINVVRTQTPDFGASVRFVIQPGWEAGSLLHMPGGPSAHPLSPYHSAGHDDWVRGEPSPLQPGRVKDHLLFVPGTE